MQYKVKHIPLKRAFDIIFSFFALSFGFPVFLVIALAIGLTSRGTIIYSHSRIGRGGVPFKCYKFRTMRKNADELLKNLLDKNPELRIEWEQNRKLRGDPRVTPVGAFLRKTSLDELPQFWNVLVGDLSIVGPRPVVQVEMERYYGSKSGKILSMRPGLTGLWQVNGRSDTGYVTRVALDEAYIDNQSMLLDIALILKTIPAMIDPKGAY